MPNDLTPTASLDPTAAIPLGRSNDRRADESADGVEATTLSAAMRGSLARSGGITGVLVAAAPAIAFVVADATGGLTWGFIAVAVAAPVAFGVRLARRESLRGAWSAWP